MGSWAHYGRRNTEESAFDRRGNRRGVVLPNLRPVQARNVGPAQSTMRRTTPPSRYKTKVPLPGKGAIGAADTSGFWAVGAPNDALAAARRPWRRAGLRP